MRISEDSAHVGAIGLALEPLAWKQPSASGRGTTAVDHTCRTNMAHIRQSRPVNLGRSEQRGRVVRDVYE